MISIFVWPGLLQGNVGHASMRIDGTASLPEQYVSWWPAGAGGIVDFLTDQTIPAALHSFEDDDEAEGFVNFHTISFGSLDEDRIRTWWESWKSDMSYRLFHRNCATTVAKALATGNHDVLTLQDDSSWTPFGVWAYAQQVYWTRQLLGNP